MSADLRIGYLMQNGAPDMSTPSGPQLHVKEVVEGLQKNGHVVNTLAIQNRRLSWSEDLDNWSLPEYGFSRTKGFRLLESSVRRVQYELTLPFLGLFDSLHFADACQHQLSGYDIYYERHGYLGYGGVLASRWQKVPIVIEINGNIVKEIDEIGVQMSKLQRNIGKWVTYRTWSSATHLLVVSEALKDQLIRSANISEENITVLQNGANVELFAGNFDGDSIRRKYNLGSSQVIAFTGSFQPWHGVDLLILSFAMLAENFPDSCLVLIGSGAGMEDARSMVSSMGLDQRVIFTGRLAQVDVAALLSIADILVAPYPFIHEDILGSPLKLIEYMAAGKAIVASKAPIHELVNDGENGIRVEPADAAALTRGIVKLLDDGNLRQLLGDTARQQAINNYSWEQVVSKLEKLLYELVDESKRNPVRSPLSIGQSN